MTKLLKQTVDRLRELPTDVQDIAARVLLFQLDQTLSAEIEYGTGQF